MAGGAAGDRYTRVAIAFHWIIAALVLWNLAGGLGGYVLPEGVSGVFWSGHKAVGICVLFLSIARLAWRLGHRPPPLPAMPRWQVATAHATHWLFYALIILMPLSGWVFTSASLKRGPISVFGLFDIPYLPIAQGAQAGAVPHGFHVYAGWFLAALAALHIAAALKHQFVDKDLTLARMMPGAAPKSI